MAYTYDQLKGANVKSDPEMLKYLAKAYSPTHSASVLNSWTSGKRNFQSDLSHVLEGKSSPTIKPGTRGLFGAPSQLYSAVDKFTNWNSATNDPSMQAQTTAQKTQAEALMKQWVADSSAKGIDVTSSKTYMDYAKKLGLNGGVAQTAEQTAVETQAGVEANAQATLTPEQQAERQRLIESEKAGNSIAQIDPKTGISQIQAEQGVKPTVGADGQPIGQTDAQGNNVAGNTLDEIQASPIPPLPPEYGQGSGLDQANWALQHRQNIFNAYQKYGITPSAEEVNWQLQNNPDINSIESSIAQAVQSGQDTRGKMPVGSDAELKAKSVIDSLTSTDANGQEKGLADVVKEFSQAMGLDDITSQIEDVDNAMGEEIMATNDNPWLSEAERSKRTQLIQAKYESKKQALVERLRLQSDAVDKAVSYYEKDREYKTEVMFKTLDLQSQELDRQLEAEFEASKTNTTFQTADGRNLMITYDRNGQIVNQQDLGGAYKPSSGGGGGGGGGATAKNSLGENPQAQLNKEMAIDTEAKQLKRKMQSGEMDWGEAWNSIYDKYSNYLEQIYPGENINSLIDNMLEYQTYRDNSITADALKSAFESGGLSF